MNGVRFGNYHSFDDFQLILGKKEIGSPAAKINKIEIEGADGALDLTEFFGETKYSNVVHKFEFSTTVPRTQLLPLYSSIKNALHGQKMRIVIDDDPHFYYIGRVSVSQITSNRNIGHIEIEVDCEPYKYKLEKTIVSKAVNGSEAISLTNSRKRAVPEVNIETEGSIRIEFQVSNIWDLGSGSFTLPELELVEGENIVNVTGTGTITFGWQEGDL